MGDALLPIGIILSIGIALGTVVFILIAARLRRTARKSSELEEVRDMNVQAMGYIYRLEMALQEAANKLNVKVDWDQLDKPAILDRKYLANKAITEGNREIQELASALAHMQEQLKGILPQLPTKEPK